MSWPLTILLLLLLLPPMVQSRPGLRRTNPIPDPEGTSASGEDIDDDGGEAAYRMSEGEADVSIRDTFFRLNPNPKLVRLTEHETARKSAKAEQRRRHHRHDEEDDEDGEGGGAAESDDDVQHHHRSAVLALSFTDAVNRTTEEDNCRGDLFKYRLRVPGCEPKSVVNRFCHGTCASLYIPRLRSKKLNPSFQSCAACVPAETDPIQVRLHCPGREGGELYRTLVRVKRCECRNIVLKGEAEGQAEERRRQTDQQDKNNESLKA